MDLLPMLSVGFKKLTHNGRNHQIFLSSTEKMSNPMKSSDDCLESFGNALMVTG